MMQVDLKLRDLQTEQMIVLQVTATVPKTAAEAVVVAVTAEDAEDVGFAAGFVALVVHPILIFAAVSAAYRKWVLTNWSTSRRLQ